MSYRLAAEKAYILACEESPELAELGLSILSELANKECYLAKLSMMYLHDFGGVVQKDSELAQMWANQARLMHPKLTDPGDLFDAGSRCWWDRNRFRATEQEALQLWEKAALLGSGMALYAIYDMTRNSQQVETAREERLTRAASLGSTEAMVELAQIKSLQGNKKGIVWLRAAYVLGDLRAKEMLEWTPN
jgi:TPR repeat protein